MESFFTRYKNAFVLILVLLAQAIGLATQVRSPNHASRQDSRFVHALRASMTYIITPPERLFLHIGHGLRAAWFGYIDLRHTRQQNADLKQQLDQLRMRNLALTEDARQGQRLQALLAFKQQYVGSTVTAQVIGTSGSARIMLAEGRHSVVLTNRSVGYQESRKIEVTPGKTTVVKVDPPKALISVNARPWAEVLLDGASVGQTPIANLLVTIGSHEIVFRNPQLAERKQSIVVTAKGPNRIAADLTK